jgi:hypothetical protein
MAIEPQSYVELPAPTGQKSTQAKGQGCAQDARCRKSRVTGECPASAAQKAGREDNKTGRQGDREASVRCERQARPMTHNAGNRCQRPSRKPYKETA